MIYILGVLMVALLTGGYVWGIISSILGVLTFNFFFAEPIFTFSVYNPDYLITFGYVCNFDYLLCLNETSEELCGGKCEKILSFRASASGKPQLTGGVHFPGNLTKNSKTAGKASGKKDILSYGKTGKLENAERTVKRG